MDINGLMQILSKKDPPNLDEIIHLALTNAGVLMIALNGMAAVEDNYRYNCVKVLLQIIDRQPAILYPYWDRFVKLLDSPNAYHRAIAVQALSGLALVDCQGRLESLLDRYLDMLDDKSVMVARYFAQSICKVIHAKPSQREKIINHLLDVDKTHHTQSRKDLIKADLVTSFDELFGTIQKKERILAFVERQMASSSPKARQAAKDFLKKHQKE